MCRNQLVPNFQKIKTLGGYDISLTVTNRTVAEVHDGLHQHTVTTTTIIIIICNTNWQGFLEK